MNPKQQEAENQAFKKSVEVFSEKHANRPYLTDKLEGFSYGWLAAREYLAVLDKAREEAKLEAERDALQKRLRGELDHALLKIEALEEVMGLESEKTQEEKNQTTSMEEATPSGAA